VLVLHGLCSSRLEVRHFSRHLARAGYEVVTPSIPGYTASATGGPSALQLDYREWIAHGIKELDRLAQGGRRVALCGVSLGATLALAVVIQRPRIVHALSLISTTLFYDGWNVSRWRFLLPLAYGTPLGRLYRYRERPPYGVKNERVRGWIAAELARGALSSAGAATIPTRSLREADRLIAHVKRQLHVVRSPTLMIHAREDDVASLRNVEFVRENVRADRFRELIVDDSYHMITLDNDRERAAAETLAFFDSIDLGHAKGALQAA
jgi:carboxylesterase